MAMDYRRGAVCRAIWGAQCIRFNEPPGGLDEASSILLSRIQKMKENISRMQVFESWGRWRTKRCAPVCLERCDS